MRNIFHRLFYLECYSVTHVPLLDWYGLVECTCPYYYFWFTTSDKVFFAILFFFLNSLRFFSLILYFVIERYWRWRLLVYIRVLKGTRRDTIIIWASQHGRRTFISGILSIINSALANNITSCLQSAFLDEAAGSRCFDMIFSWVGVFFCVQLVRNVGYILITCLT